MKPLYFINMRNRKLLDWFWFAQNSWVIILLGLLGCLWVAAPIWTGISVGFPIQLKFTSSHSRRNNRSWHECFDSKVPFHIGAEQSCQACIKIAIKVKTYCREKSIVSVVAQASVKCLEVISLSCFVVSDIITHYTENVWWNAVMHHFYWFCFNWPDNFRHCVA